MVKQRLLRGYRFLMPSCAGFLEPRKSTFEPLKFTFNVENFIRNLSMSISIDFDAIRNPKSPKKFYKNSYFSVQDHPWSLNSVAIESKTCY